MWTKASLQQLIRQKMPDSVFVVVSNREPYAHVLNKGKIECQRGAGGVITALDPVMRACGGIWVAAGLGDADHKTADAQAKLKVPPENPSYTLKRVWLTKEEENGFYYGYSNEALWPLCHMAFERPVFRKEDWDFYKKVNEKFAKAVIEEVGTKKAFVWIQDYHLTLLPKILRESLGKQLIIAHFWHIPWPGYDAFGICPQKKEILEGLLGNDLLGFQIKYHCDNFEAAVDREIESKLDPERFAITKGEHETLVKFFPISVDFSGTNNISTSKEVEDRIKEISEEFSLSGVKVLLGLDRLDYTKGIPERIKALDRLFDKFPVLKEKIVLLQVGELSRVHIPKYQQLNDEINMLVEEVNWKHSTENWRPVILLRRHMAFIDTIALYRLCDVCVVSSLHDGMNLVAKEFVASRSDEKGVLVLSQFTGAARELTDAVLINPYDAEDFANAIMQALNFSEEEIKKRMVKMRSIVQQNNIYRWTGKVISELLKLEFKEEYGETDSISSL